MEKITAKEFVAKNTFDRDNEQTIITKYEVDKHSILKLKDSEELKID